MGDVLMFVAQLGVLMLWSAVYVLTAVLLVLPVGYVLVCMMLGAYDAWRQLRAQQVCREYLASSRRQRMGGEP